MYSHVTCAYLLPKLISLSMGFTSFCLSNNSNFCACSASESFNLTHSSPNSFFCSLTFNSFSCVNLLVYSLDFAFCNSCFWSLLVFCICAISGSISLCLAFLSVNISCRCIACCSETDFCNASPSNTISLPMSPKTFIDYILLPQIPSQKLTIYTFKAQKSHVYRNRY